MCITNSVIESVDKMSQKVNVDCNEIIIIIIIIIVMIISIQLICVFTLALNKE
jgi:hypothetical protein